MAYKPNEAQNRAIVLLKKCGISFYFLCKVFGKSSDWTGNFTKIYKRYKDKYSLSETEKKKFLELIREFVEVLKNGINK